MQLRQNFSVLFPARRRVEIDAKARALIAEHGEGAYSKARDMARGDRAHGSLGRDAFWTKVAHRIAALTEWEIGAKGADHRPPL